jgi:thiol-disulfide isomerase/thioredoxin
MNRLMGHSRNLIVCGLLLLCSFLWPEVAEAEPYVWPAWSAQTAEGEAFHSRQLDGKVVVISVWGSWCPSCRKQLPVLSKLQEQYGASEVQVLAFSLDHSEDTHRDFVLKNRIGVPSIFARSGDGLEVVRMLQKGAGTLEAVPTVLIYDRRGRLSHRMVGFFNSQQLELLIGPLLKRE